MTSADAAEKGLTDYLVSRVVEPWDIAPEDVEVAKWFILDTLSVGLAGSREERRQVRRMALALAAAASRGPALAVPLGLRVHPAAAAGINAGATHTIDFDDSYLQGVKAHFSTTLVPVVMAVGEAVRASGAEVIEAYIRGFEVAARLGHVVSPSHLQRWHPTGTLGVVGAAAAAARLLGLDESETRTALSLAGDRATGGRFFAAAGDVTKPLHAAFAAHDGVLCAYLAQEGVQASDAFFEGRQGFVETFSDEPAQLSEAPRYALVRDNSTKFFPAMHGLHAAIVLALESAAQHGNDREVDSVTVYQCRGRAHLGRIWRPESPLSAKLSMPYVVAVSLTDGACGLRQFDVQRIHDERVLRLVDKVEIVASDELEERYGGRVATRLVVRYHGGHVTDETFVDPPGTPRRPATSEQRLAKFDTLLSEVMGPEPAAALRDAVMTLEKAPTVERVVDALATSGPVEEV